MQGVALKTSSHHDYLNIELDTRIIREVNDKLKEKCHLMNFGSTCNSVLQNHLWKDGIHFDDKGTNILAGNFVDFLNYFALDRNHSVTNNRI